MHHSQVQYLLMAIIFHMMVLVCKYLLPAMFHSQTLYCLGLNKCIWVLASTSSSDIEALPKRNFHGTLEKLNRAALIYAPVMYYIPTNYYILWLQHGHK